MSLSKRDEEFLDLSSKIIKCSNKRCRALVAAWKESPSDEALNETLKCSLVQCRSEVLARLTFLKISLTVICTGKDKKQCKEHLKCVSDIDKIIKAGSIDVEKYRVLEIKAITLVMAS
jgi:hypothetical protein